MVSEQAVHSIYSGLSVYLLLKNYRKKLFVSYFGRITYLGKV